MAGTQVLVGVFGAAQGVRGEVRIKSYTGEPLAIGSYGPLATADGRRAFTVLSLRLLKDDMLVARIEGVADRDAAARLTNTELYVPRERLPPSAEDEVYHVDLIGLEAEDEGGAALGRVAGVEDYGGGAILAIIPAFGGEPLLIPFTRAFVPVVDLAGRRIVVARGALLPEGEDGARQVGT